jgi:hypothetical protein
MLREEVYQKVASEFGTSVGVASILGFKRKEDHVLEYTPESYKELSDTADINGIICKAIDNEWYQRLQREIYKVKKEASPKIKEVTIYKRAWKELTNGSTRQHKNTTKSGEVYSKI